MASAHLPNFVADGTWKDIVAVSADAASGAIMIQNRGDGSTDVAIVAGGNAAPTNTTGTNLNRDDSITLQDPGHIWVRCNNQGTCPLSILKTS